MKMEVKVTLGCLLVVGLSVGVQPELLPVHCSNCTCVSSNGAKLHLRAFNSPMQLSNCNLCGCARGVFVY